MDFPNRGALLAQLALATRKHGEKREAAEAMRMGIQQLSDILGDPGANRRARTYERISEYLARPEIAARLRERATAQVETSDADTQKGGRPDHPGGGGVYPNTWGEHRRALGACIDQLTEEEAGELVDTMMAKVLEIHGRRGKTAATAAG